MLKRFILTYFLLLCSCLGLAQERYVLKVPNKTNRQSSSTYNQRTNVYNPSKRYKRRELNLHTITLGFVQNTLKEKDYRDLKSYMGVCASYGQMVLLGSDPSTWNFGFDFVYVDMNYTQYKLRYHEEGRTTDYQWHLVEAGVQAGVALLWAPTDEFGMKVYARYVPTYSSFYVDNKWQTGYGDYAILGLSASVGQIGLGGDFRYGTCRQKEFSYTGRFTNLGMRLYACFNF